MIKKSYGIKIAHIKILNLYIMKNLEQINKIIIQY